MKANSFAAAVLLAAMATAAPLSLVKRAGTTYNGGETATDITDGVCAPVTFLFARGSTEPGTMGTTVGPALAKALISQYGAENLAVQGVDYPATIESNASLGSEGGPEMATLGEQAIKQCPSTKLILSGYSQGGLVTHYAVQSAGLPVNDVAAVVLYGDPEQKETVGSVPAAKVKQFCASGDGVCETGTFSVSAAHLSYTTNGDIQSGATFVQSAIGAVGSGTASGSTPAASAPATPAGSAAPAPASSSAAAAGGLGSLGGLGGLGGAGASPSGIPGLGGGAGGLGGLGGLGGAGASPSGFPGLGGGAGGLGGLGGLGGAGAAPSGFPGLGGGAGGLGGLGGLGGAGASPSGLPGLGGGLGGLGSGASGADPLASGLPGLGGSDCKVEYVHV